MKQIPWFDNIRLKTEKKLKNSEWKGYFTLKLPFDSSYISKLVAFGKCNNNLIVIFNVMNILFAQD